MRTVLDEAEMWFVHAIVYRGDLHVIVVEGFTSDAPRDIHVGDYLLQNVHPIEVEKESRFFEVRFPRPVAWQVVDEEYSRWDEYEQGDTGTLRILEQSRYFDYVKENHGWFADTVGPAKHYRLWTADEVVDVVACTPPTIETWVPPDESTDQ